MTPSRVKGYSVYQEARVNEYEQSELILMMFSGIVNFLDKALAVSPADKHQMGNYLTKAKNILLEIMSSLNLEEGGEIGRLLLNTYSRQYHTLHAAHMSDDREKVMLVRNSLAEIGDAWKEVFNSDEYRSVKRRARKKYAGAFSQE